MQNQKNKIIEVDFIVIGQGLSGSVLAFSLIQSGYTVHVLNNPSLSSCSRVAAGIWNPVVFKRLTQSWLANELIPELISFYTTCENKLGIKLLQHRHIIKPFTELQEKLFWKKKSETENAFLDKLTYENLLLSTSQLIPSYSKVLQAGNLDVRIFLEGVKLYLKSNHSYVEEELYYNQIVSNVSGIAYNNIKSKSIIFCDGHLINKNPFFNWIPMKPAKGEVFTIKCPDLKLQQDILNKGLFVMPLGNDYYRVGATYEWELLNDEPSEKRKVELSQKLSAIISTPFEIIKHDAGIRPSVIDRRPVVGKHPEINNMYIFNGMGSKGVMLAPYFAKQFVNFIKHDLPIHAEVNPARFYKK